MIKQGYLAFCFLMYASGLYAIYDEARTLRDTTGTNDTGHLYVFIKLGKHALPLFLASRVNIYATYKLLCAQDALASQKELITISFIWALSAIYGIDQVREIITNLKQLKKKESEQLKVHTAQKL